MSLVSRNSQHRGTEEKEGTEDSEVAEEMMFVGVLAEAH
jgi:hypothetical protein